MIHQKCVLCRFWCIAYVQEAHGKSHCTINPLKLDWNMNRLKEEVLKEQMTEKKNVVIVW